MIIEWTEVPSPVGTLTLAAAESRLVALCFAGLWEKRVRDFERRFEDCRLVRRGDAAGAKARLARYFEGDLAALDDIEVESHGTPFQQAVWRQLRLIPAGQTRSYAEIAAAVGAPAAVRAVGAANGANPIGIVVPCHRVIGSNGKLTGFAGGLASKRWLLDHESAQRRLPSASAAA